jgi:hypothetical protein
MAGKDKTHIFDNPRNVKRVLQLLYVCCGIVLVLDLFVHRHMGHPWEELPGFYGLYGFAGIVILVLLAKELRKLVLRKEDYYDD